MGAFSLPTTGPSETQNPLLDSIHEAVRTGDLSKLSPEAHEAIRRSGVIPQIAAKIDQPPAQPAPQIVSKPGPGPLAVPQPTAAPAMPLAPGVGANTPAGALASGPPPPNPLTPQEQADQHVRDVAGQGTFPGIHNKFLHGLATAGDVVLGTFAPRAEQLVPGTAGHHALELGQAEQGANFEAQRNLREQQAAKANADIGESQARGHLANAQATQIEQGGKFAPKASYVPVGDGLFDASSGEWIKEPSDKTQAKLIEVPPEIGKALVAPNADGKYMLPDAAIAEVVRAKMIAPAEKEGEMPIGDERAASTNASNAALYKEAGLPVPAYATLTGKHTQKDEARVVDAVKAEVAAHRTNQEFSQREADRRAQVSVNAGNRASDQTNKAYDNFDKKMTAELTPLQSQIDTVQEARKLINGGSVQQFLGTVKSLVAVAGGKGTGVRITQPELNGIPAATGIAGGFEGFINSLEGKGKLNSDQIRQVNDSLSQIEALATEKRDRVNKYLDQAVSARNPDDIKRIEQSYRHDQAQGSNAAGGNRGGGQLPGGITLQDIDAEIARRKAKK